MFVHCSFYILGRPIIKAIDGMYEVSFPLDPDMGELAPTLRIEAADGTTIEPNVVVRPDIVSLAIGHTDQRVTVLPDGHLIYHNLDLLMQDTPCREGVQLSFGTITVNVSPAERTIVSGAGFSLEIERDGKVHDRKTSPSLIDGSSNAGSITSEDIEKIALFQPRGQR